LNERPSSTNPPSAASRGAGMRRPCGLDVRLEGADRLLVVLPQAGVGVFLKAPGVPVTTADYRRSDLHLNDAHPGLPPQWPSSSCTAASRRCAAVRRLTCANAVPRASGVHPYALANRCGIQRIACPVAISSCRRAPKSSSKWHRQEVRPVESAILPIRTWLPSPPAGAYGKPGSLNPFLPAVICVDSVPTSETR
jgi:hypothetical protein